MMLWSGCPLEAYSTAVADGRWERSGGALGGLAQPPIDVSTAGDDGVVADPPGTAGPKLGLSGVYFRAYEGITAATL